MPVLSPAAGAYFEHLLSPSDDLTRTADVEITYDRVMYRFHRGADAVEFELTHPSSCQSPEGPLCLVARRSEGPGGEKLRDEGRALLVAALRRAPEGPPWVIPSPPERLHRDQPWIVLGELFFLLLLIGVLVAVWRERRRLVSREAPLAALLVALALLVRFVAHAGNSDIRAVLHGWGRDRAGWVALVQFLYEVLPNQDETIWTINRFVGALSVALLYAVMRRRFADPLVATSAAAALAVTPLLARFSATDAPYIILCAALLGSVLAFDRFVETASATTLALALGLLTATMQLRPEAPWLIVPTVLVVLAGRVDGGTTRRRPLWRPSTVTCVLAWAAFNAFPTVWARHGNTPGLSRTFVLAGAMFGSPWAEGDMTPWPLGLLVLLGALLALLNWYGRPGRIWLVAVLVAFPADIRATAQFGNARYHIPSMYLACGLIGFASAALFHEARRRLKREIPVPQLTVIGLLCLFAVPRADLLRRMWTPQSEFELFRSGLRHIEPDCRVVTWNNGGDAGFIPYDYLVPNGLLDIEDFLANPPDAYCIVYYRAGNCFTTDWVPDTELPTFVMTSACRALEGQFRLEPILEAQVPARPYRGEHYALDPLPLGFYRLASRVHPVAP